MFVVGGDPGGGGGLVGGRLGRRLPQRRGPHPRVLSPQPYQGGSNVGRESCKLQVFCYNESKTRNFYCRFTSYVWTAELSSLHRGRTAATAWGECSLPWAATPILYLAATEAVGTAVLSVVPRLIYQQVEINKYMSVQKLRSTNKLFRSR